ncbi:MAG: ComEC/Rec2 family competence protein [Fidelibacterota bacterium]
MLSVYSTAPALRYLLFFIPGILLQDILKLPFWLPVLILCATIILIAVCRKAGRIPDYLFIACIAVSGMLRGGLAEQSYLQKLFVTESGETATELTVLQQKTTPYNINYYLVETDVNGTAIRATLYARSGLPVLIPGRSYRMEPVEIKVITPNRNPYGFNYMQYAKTKGITHRINTNAETVVSETGINAPLRYIAHQVRCGISVRFLCILGIEKGSLVNGLLLGMKSEIPDSISERFRELGISHLLAVSGLHVGLIVIIVYQLLLTLSLPRLARTILICAFLFFYCYLSGSSPSVIRSSLMTAILLMAPVFQRRYHAVNAVAATAVILLMANPYYLRDIGFQFSFAAVFGILTGYRILKNKLAFRSANPVLIYAYEMLLVSASAALFTAPIALYYFNTLQIASLLLNIIAIPLTFCVMITAMLSIPCIYFPSFFSDIILHALDLALTLFRALLRTASCSGIWTCTVSSYWKPLVTGMVLTVAAGLFCSKKKDMYILLTIIGVITLLCFYLNGRPEMVQPALKRGKSLVFRSGREALIINTGARAFNSNDYDASIKPMLDHWGVKRVNVVITEDEKYKTGNIPYIRRDFPDCSVVYPGKEKQREIEYKGILRDSSWSMGKQQINIRVREDKLSLCIRTDRDSIIINNSGEEHSRNINTNAQLQTARHFLFAGKHIRQRE